MRGPHRAGTARAGSPALSPRLEPQFPALDSLRAVGALLVLTTHTTFTSGDYQGHGWLGTFFARMDVGVALFFVLSGFLLSRPWIARAELALPAPATGRYYWKRLLRVYPVYVVTVVVAMTLLEDNRGASASDWLRALTLTDIYSETALPAGLTQMWSLATEVAFYLVLPLLMAVLVGRRRTWRPAVTAAGLGAMLALSCWWTLEGAWSGDLADRALPLQWLPSYLSWFGLGIAMAALHVLRDRATPPAAARLLLRGVGSVAAAPGASAIAAVALLLVASTPLAGPTLLELPSPGAVLTKNLLYTCVAFLLVAPAVFGRPDSRYAALMSLRLPRRLGHISYSVFCIHLPVLHFVMWWRDYTPFTGHGVEIWTLTLVLSLAASEALYRVVELPFLRLRNLGARPSPAAVRTTATATTTASPGHAHDAAKPSDPPHGRQE